MQNKTSSQTATDKVNTKLIATKQTGQVSVCYDAGKPPFIFTYNYITHLVASLHHGWYSARTAIHPTLAAIAARVEFRGTALVVEQEPVGARTTDTGSPRYTLIERKIILLY